MYSFEFIIYLKFHIFLNVFYIYLYFIFRTFLYFYIHFIYFYIYFYIFPFINFQTDALVNYSHSVVVVVVGGGGGQIGALCARHISMTIYLLEYQFPEFESHISRKKKYRCGYIKERLIIFARNLESTNCMIQLAE